MQWIRPQISKGSLNCSSYLIYWRLWFVFAIGIAWTPVRERKSAYLKACLSRIQSSEPTNPNRVSKWVAKIVHSLGTLKTDTQRERRFFSAIGQPSISYSHATRKTEGHQPVTLDALRASGSVHWIADLGDHEGWQGNGALGVHCLIVGECLGSLPSACW